MKVLFNKRHIKKSLKINEISRKKSNIRNKVKYKESSKNNLLRLFWKGYMGTQYRGISGKIMPERFKS